jgi:Zn finger protein HypA/HybF (possibly regulating hydrogenase expression)
MHEVAAMQGMVQTALEHMRAAGATRVSRITLVLGASGHFTAEAAQQHFAMLTAGTPLETATLKIEWLPATFQCFNCLYNFESCEAAEQVTCPKCGGVALEIAHQHVCYVSSIDVDDEDREGTPPVIETGTVSSGRG